VRPFEEVVAAELLGLLRAGAPARAVRLTVRELVVARLERGPLGPLEVTDATESVMRAACRLVRSVEAPEELVEIVCRATLEVIRGHGGESTRWPRRAGRAGPRAGGAGDVASARLEGRHDMIGIVEVNVATLARNWWAIALRGVAAILFGVLTVIWPDLSLAVLVILFGSYTLLEGIFNVIAAVRLRQGERRWLALLLEGLVSVAVGAVTLVLPGLTALALIFVIAAWAILTGVLEIVAAARLHRLVRGAGWLALSGVLSLVFGVLVACFPGAGALSLLLWVAAYSIVFGGLLLLLAFRLRSMRAAVPGGLAQHA
jgi:uncharacterized membrane protein HdeD (DUF308 family)